MAKKKAKKHDLKWIKQTLELDKDHLWRSKPGYQVFVAGRGAVRFDVPVGWHFEPKKDSFRFTDKPGEAADCGLEVSFNLLPPGDWRQLPIEKIMVDLVAQDSRNPIETYDIVTLPRQTAHVVWTEFKFIDPGENREAFSRTCVAIGSGVQCLITFEYWPEDGDRFRPVWDEVLNTLTLGLYIDDPRTGAARPD